MRKMNSFARFGSLGYTLRPFHIRLFIALVSLAVLILAAKFGIEQVLMGLRTNDLMLVSEQNALPSNYVPRGLQKVTMGSAEDDIRLPSHVLAAWENMVATAEKDGLHLILHSGYRSYAQQRVLYHQGQAYGCEAYAPGLCEHQTGLAIDVGAATQEGVDALPFDKTDEGIWLSRHAHEYGFILRFPESKQERTGTSYSPTHYRYVGKRAAAEILARNICLEEYLNTKPTLNP